MATKPKDKGRWSVRATNHTTGASWAIHGTRAVCLTELQRVLTAWGGCSFTVDGPIQIEE